MDITVRTARPADHAAAGELAVRGYTADGLLSAGAEDPYASVLRDAAERARRAELLVAADGRGTLLGTVTFASAPPYAEVARPDEAEFRMLAVAPEGRGRGCGELLVRACLERAVALGRRAVVLSTTGTVPAAVRLYERLGFTHAPERAWYPFEDGPLYVYRYDLTGN